MPRLFRYALRTAVLLLAAVSGSLAVAGPARAGVPVDIGCQSGPGYIQCFELSNGGDIVQRQWFVNGAPAGEDNTSFFAMSCQIHQWYLIRFEVIDSAGDLGADEFWRDCHDVGEEDY